VIGASNRLSGMKNTIAAIILLFIISSSAHAQSPSPTPKPSPISNSEANPTATPVPPPMPSPTPSPNVQQSPPIVEPLEQNPTQETGKRFFPFVGLGYNTSSDAKFSNVSASGNSQYATGTIDYSVAPAASVDLGVYFLPPDKSYGGEIAVIYEQTRSINSINANLNGTIAGGVFTNNPTIQLTIIEANFIVRARYNFYFPLGFNYSIPNVQGGANSGTSSQTLGDLGAQVGIGFQVGDNLHFEALARATSVTVKETIGQYSYDLGPGYLTGAEVRFRFAF
jgi:hypothetical protein